jgi:fructose-1,6-bisphosphatase/inositol monophosphatase family enzyme
MSGYWASAAWAAARTPRSSARGRAEAWVELEAKAWDLAPFKVLARRPGARFFNFDGGSSIHNGSAVICSPFLEDELRELVRSSA